MRATQAPMTSRRLCGGILVAMPTAMPSVPFTSRLGKRQGRTSGSRAVPSKLGFQSTVDLSMSVRSSLASGVIRHSVYR